MLSNDSRCWLFRNECLEFLLGTAGLFLTGPGLFNELILYTLSPPLPLLLGLKPDPERDLETSSSAPNTRNAGPKLCLLAFPDLSKLASKDVAKAIWSAASSYWTGELVSPASPASSFSSSISSSGAKLFPSSFCSSSPSLPYS